VALTPDQEARHALDFGVPRGDLSMPAQLIYDQLVSEGATPGPLGHESPARFPSEPEARREILEAIARANPKYARPFDKGNMATVSLIGTESWSDYGAVVLQMAILDTLLSIEEKLTKLAEPT
jgi:hypothetical protein